MAEQNTPPRQLTDVPGLSTWNDKNGINVEGQHYTWDEVSRDEGLRSVAQGTTNTIYRSVNGGFTTNPSLSVASGGLSLNTETGDINVNASDNILNSSFYKNDLKPQLLQLSQAYKLNPDYKFKYTKYNEDGTTEESETTVPEYVERLNEGLLSYVDTVNRAKQNLSTYADKYGDKAYNLSDEQIVMSVDIGGKTIPIPDYLLRDPKFSSLKDKVANGRVSLEDFAKVYDRDNLGRQEMAELLGGIETRLQYADWGDDWYEGENGEQIYNENGANEAAKMIAFREYILANDPKSEWYQAVGDNLMSFTLNAAQGATNVLGGVLNIAEGQLTLGNSKLVQNQLKKMDTVMEQWNSEQMLVNDATQWLAAAGYIGGTIGGTYALQAVAGAALSGITGAAEASLTNAANTVSTMFGPSAQAALSAKTMASIVKSSDEITRGARFLMKVAPLAEKVGWATSFANDVKAVMAQHKALSTALGTPVAIMLDTIHDTLLYNSADLRDVLEASDQETRDFWLGELADNAKWWLGWETLKGSLKGSRWVVKGVDKAATSGRMGTVGLVASKYVNKAIAGAGDAKMRLKDKLAGGDLVAKLQTKIDEAIEKGDVRKAGRLNNKKVITEQNSILRAARREFGNIDLNLEGLRLSDKTVSDLMEKGSAIRFWENSIDRFISGVREVRSEMIGGIRNPATGKITFVNPTLAAANTKATDYYMKLADLAKKYHLKVAKDSFISQDMIDYTMTIYDIHRYSVIADGNGPNASKAAEAVERLNANLEALEGKLPDEIKTYIANNYWEAYTNFYTELNKYGIAKKLLNETKLSSYMNSKEWQEIGYMPSIKLQEETGHRIIDTDGKISATIEQEFGQLTYAVQEGQHYIDPELTRQSRINRMAQAQVNAEMLNSYVANTGAAFTTVMGGETTDYVERVMNGKKALEKSIDSYTREFADYFEIRQPQGRVSPLKNKVVPIGERDVAISTFTLTETKQILTDMGVLPGVGENSLVQGVTEENFDDWYNMLNKRAQSFLDAKFADYGEKSFVNLQEILQREGDDFELGLQQAYLIGDKDFARSPLLRQAMQNLEDGRTAFYEGVTKEQAISALRQIVGNDVNLGGLVDDVYASFRTATDDFVSTMLDDGGVKAAFDAMSKDVLAPEQSAKYLALKALKEKGRDNVTQSLNKAIKTTTDELKLNEADAVKFRKKVQTLFDDYLDNQIDDAANAVKAQGGQVVDPEEVFDEVSKLNKEILALEKEVRSPVEDSTRIMFLDQQGRQAFAQVDPAFASLYNRRYVLEGGEANALAKFNAAMSKIFRYGTTSVNIASMGNQLFRDFGDALMLGGAWRTIKNSADDLQHVWGKNIAEQIKAFDPTGYEMRQVEAFATANGLTTEEAAALRELSKGAARAPSSTERQIYKDLWKKLEKDSGTKMEQMKTSLGEWVEKLNPDEIVNGKRENYLRNRVFANGYNDALQRGYTVQQAREFATFAMNNATTNFGRQVYHLQAIAESTPYFSAAINGHKSFWRMWAMDPIGITSRITGGLIFPTIALVGMSLGDPENREIYEKIPEYQKADSLVFVINKQVLSIPIPQQIAAVVAPFRQFTEYLYDANKNDFWELMMNDALGFSPYDLQGFSTIDVDRMLGDPDLGDRINRGFARLFSQMAPVPVKTAYMLATHTDPYTGKTLQDSSYWYWNEETGSTELMDYTQNAFAKMLADNGILGANATVWQKVLTGLFGQTGTDVLDDITTVFSKGLEQAGRTTAENILGQATKPFSVGVYDPVDGAWRRAVNALTQEKEAILADKETKVLLTELQQTSDPEKRLKINAKLQDRVNEFHQKVDNMVKRLSSEYGGSLDRYKLGAVVQLLNFNTDPAWQTGTQYSSDTASAEYYDGRTVAYQMMTQMGIRGAEDLSMLGYSVIDENTGRPAMKYTKPTAILDLKYTTYAQNDINLANLTATITDADLWNKHESIKEQMDALYSAKDYNKYEAVQINWNAEVAKTIAPYLAQMTPEAALNNTQALNYLYPLIEVPYSWEKNNKGKSANLGSRGNKKKAYYESWIKTMFSVNDKYKGQY